MPGSRQWRNNHITGVVKVQGSELLVALRFCNQWHSKGRAGEADLPGGTILGAAFWENIIFLAICLKKLVLSIKRSSAILKGTCARQVTEKLAIGKNVISYFERN